MNNNGKTHNKQYLIDLHKWRSVAALFACIVTLVFAGIGLGGSIILYTRNKWELAEFFRFFTTIANLITAVSAAFIVPYAVEGVKKKRFITPSWLSVMHFCGTICTTLVFIFAITFILSTNPEMAVGGNNLFFHIVCPIAIFISFELVESGHDYKPKDIIFSLIPVFIYSVVYLIMVVFVGKDNGGWEDLYMLNTYTPAYISLPLVWILAAAVAFIIYRLSYVLNKKRQTQLFEKWESGMGTIELNIEVYGLGRFYGINSELNSLTIPIDILDFLAKKYNRNTEDLTKIFVKGMLNGYKESSESPEISKRVRS